MASKMSLDVNNKKLKGRKHKSLQMEQQEIHGIYIDHGVDVTFEEVQEMVKAADKDGTGMLTEKEFVESGAQEVSRLLAMSSKRNTKVSL